MDAHIPAELSRDMSIKKAIAGSSPNKAEALRFVYDVIEQAEDEITSDFDLEELKNSKEEVQVAV